jgi:hypothetical protein
MQMRTKQNGFLWCSCVVFALNDLELERLRILPALQAFMSCWAPYGPWQENKNKNSAWVKVYQVLVPNEKWA